MILLLFTMLSFCLFTAWHVNRVLILFLSKFFFFVFFLFYFLSSSVHANLQKTTKLRKKPKTKFCCKHSDTKTASRRVAALILPHQKQPLQQLTLTFFSECQFLIHCQLTNKSTKSLKGQTASVPAIVLTNRVWTKSVTMNLSAD